MRLTRFWACLVLLAALSRGAARAEEPAPIRVKPDQGEARILGRVVDEKGSPLAGAKIFAYTLFDLASRSATLWMFGASPVPEPRITATSGADGTFEIAGLATGPYSLRVESADGRVGEATEVTVAAANPPRIRCKVPDCTAVSGRVVEHDGKPVADALVGVEPSLYLPYPPALLLSITSRTLARTDRDGAFRLLAPTVAESLYLTVTSADGTRTTTPAQGGPWIGSVPTWKPGTEFRMSKRERVAGRVRGALSGRAIDGALVTVLSTNDAVHELVTARSAADGTFSMELPAGWTQVAAYAEAAGIGGDGVALKEGEPFEIPIRRGVDLVGRLATPDGTPIEGARVIAWGTHSPARAARTDASGVYRFERLPRTNINGELSRPDDDRLLSFVWVEAPGYGAGLVLPVIAGFAVERRQDIVATRGASIRGRLAAGSALTFVGWWPAPAEPDASLMFPLGTTVGEDGSFLLNDLPAGRIVLAPDKGGPTLELKAGEKREGVVVVAPKPPR